MVLYRTKFLYFAEIRETGTYFDIYRESLLQIYGADMNFMNTSHMCNALQTIGAQ